jgi:hypothetical protein
MRFLRLWRRAYDFPLVPCRKLLRRFATSSLSCRCSMSASMNLDGLEVAVGSVGGLPGTSMTTSTRFSGEQRASSSCVRSLPAGVEGFLSSGDRECAPFLSWPGLLESGESEMKWDQLLSLRVEGTDTYHVAICFRIYPRHSIHASRRPGCRE